MNALPRLIRLAIVFVVGLLIGAGIATHELTIRVEERNRANIEQIQADERHYEEDLARIRQYVHDQLADCRPTAHKTKLSDVIDPNAVRYFTQCGSDGRCVTSRVVRGTVQ
jgi:hypothetical protein